MPTVPMFIRHPQPTDASHGVFAPGGYEWWHFDAEDEKGGLIAAVDFFKGCPAHPEYIRRHKQYKSSPTRHAPPLPEEYPCVSAVMYEQHVPILSFHRALGAGDLAASDQTLKISAAASGVADERPKGGISVFAADPASGKRIELTFHPLLPPQSWAGRDWSGAGLHHWVLCDPLCRVEGEVQVGAGGGVRKMKGFGYRDYSYGTGPIGYDARGRALTEERFVAIRARGGVVEGTVAGIVQDRTPELAGTITFDKYIDAGDFLRTKDVTILGNSAHGQHVVCSVHRAGRKMAAFGEVVGPRMDWDSLAGKLTAR